MFMQKKYYFWQSNYENETFSRLNYQVEVYRQKYLITFRGDAFCLPLSFSLHLFLVWKFKKGELSSFYECYILFISKYGNVLSFTISYAF